MNIRSTTFTITLLGVLCASSAFAHVASAQDANVEIDADVGISPVTLPNNPLKKLREKAQGINNAIQVQKQEFRDDRKEFIQEKADVKAGIKEERKEFWQDTVEERKAMHAETKAELEAATTPQEKKSILKIAQQHRAEFRMQVKTDSAAMRESFRAKRNDLRQEARDLIADKFVMIMNRLVNALERFDQILGRIDSRIEKMRADGIDVSTAVSASVSANLSVDAASVAIADAQAAIEVAASSDTPRDHFEEVRTAVRAAVDAVKAAHEAIKNALRALKGLAGQAETSASLERSASTDTSN
ncbi:MAG: hypothetical protein G01um10148_54 [Parcubacteria group bacterium Gr01-1014_8]|nr:MAG: hypothetical protein G01um10148_54 [Parcubacteria group bacterium Gr01-1014_8]